MEDCEITYSKGQQIIKPLVLRVSNIKIVKVKKGHWKRDPRIYGTDENNIVYAESIEAQVSDVYGNIIPVVIMEGNNMVTWEEKIIPPKIYN